MDKVTFKVNAVTIFIAGVLVGALFTSVIFLARGNRTPVDYTAGSGSNTQQSVDTGSADNGTSDYIEANYQTDIKEFTLTMSDGSTVSLHTPTGYYSLSDQYLEAMKSYYGDLDAFNNMVTVGNDASLNYASMIISASTLSATESVIRSVYTTSTDEEIEAMLYSDAYYLMKTGEVPEHEDSDGDLKVTEIKVETVNGIDWHFYKLSYTQEYYTDETQTETVKIPTEELVVYSDTEDAIEIVCFSSDEVLDFEEAIARIDEFIQ